MNTLPKCNFCGACLLLPLGWQALSSPPRDAGQEGMSGGSVLRPLLRTWCAEPKGRALLAAWAVVATGATLRAVYLRRRAKKRVQVCKTLPKREESASANRATPLRQVQRLAVPRLRSAPVVWCALLSGGIGMRLLVHLCPVVLPLVPLEPIAVAIVRSSEQPSARFS